MSDRLNPIRVRARRACALPICLALLVMAPRDAIGAPKTDVVEFGNGSRLVGELKSVDRGKLYFKTDTTDTIALDWADVTTLVTNQRLRVIERNGERVYGSLRLSDEPGMLIVNGRNGERVIATGDIATIDPIDDTVWDRLDIDVSTGYAFTKSTGAEQMNFALEVEYETDERSRTFKAESTSSDSDGSESNTTSGLAFETFRLRRDRWGSGWLAGMERNDALALEYRATAASGLAQRYFPTANQRFRIATGLQLNNEKFKSDEAQTSVESFLVGSFDWFRFSEPELDLSTTAYLFPSLTDTGRVRGSLDLTLRWEIVKDFFWQVSLYDDYDNKANEGQSDADAETNDYGITTSLGWSH
jgi:small nuclear ribonucleoprotein (snRNP)-like protein